jgi:hypothetical protein
VRADPTHDLPGQIIDTLEELEKATEVYGSAIDRAAVAEAKFKLAHADALIRLASGALPGKMTAATRDAHALIQSRDEYEISMVYDAAAEAAKQYLYTLRARLDALRTLNANVRLLTDPRLPT